MASANGVSASEAMLPPPPPIPQTTSIFTQPITEGTQQVMMGDFHISDNHFSFDRSDTDASNLGWTGEEDEEEEGS